MKCRSSCETDKRSRPRHLSWITRYDSYLVNSRQVIRLSARGDASAGS